MDSQILISDESITDKIYLIRNHKVMLDYDLAELYNVETRVLNQAVSRNLERFPEDFMFQLDDKEWSSLKSQFVTSKDGRGGRRKLPYVFTEHGVLMLSSILNSQRAIQMNIQIVRIFTRLRLIVANNNEIRLDIEKIKRELHNQGKNMEIIFNYLDELAERLPQNHSEPKGRKRLGFKPDDI